MRCGLIQLLIVGGVAWLISSRASGQTPPPMALPNSVTGQPANGAITPAAASVAVKTPAIARYPNLSAVPPETAQAILGMRTGAEWLAKRQLTHGKFLIGLNPALRMPIDGDTDFRQAVATWGLAQAATFTGDDKLTAAASQAVLTLLTLCPESSTPNGPQAPSSQVTGSPVGFAAVLALSIYDLPKADPRLVQNADRICAYLRTQVNAEGMLSTPEKADFELMAFVPGLVYRALVDCDAHAGRTTITAPIGTMTTAYRATFRTKPSVFLAAGFLPGAVDLYTINRSTDAAGMALEMADWLCTMQATRTNTRNFTTLGSFPQTGQEPGYDSAFVVQSLAAATKLTRQLPDLARYPKYRNATVDGMTFLRSLQATADTTPHFTGEFRAEYLIGGVRVGLTDGNLRADATAATMLAYLQFLESGADRTE